MDNIKLLSTAEADFDLRGTLKSTRKQPEAVKKIRRSHFYRTDRKKKKSTTTVRQGLRMVILAYGGSTEFVNHRSDWVVYHTSESNIAYFLFTGPTAKEPPRPKPSSMTMKEVDSDYDPM